MRKRSVFLDGRKTAFSQAREIADILYTFSPKGEHTLTTTRNGLQRQARTAQEKVPSGTTLDDAENTRAIRRPCFWR